MKITLFALLLLFTIPCFSQNSDNPDNLRAKIYELKVKTIPGDDLKLPFQSIKIIDSRFDTSKLGFKITGKMLVSVNKVFEKIALKTEVKQEIETFYNEYYKNNFTSNGKHLLIVIKKLWSNSMPDRLGERQRNDINRLSKQDIHAKFEYYFNAGNVYVPLKRIDTLFQLTTDKNVDGYNQSNEEKLPFICFALEKMVENINYEIYSNVFDNKKKMSLAEIMIYNEKIKNISILTEPINKGVYLTFDELKTTHPQ
ncbi:MAG: hypothetical protein WKF59_02520 [Chitinophagaceae bacterium]